MCLYALLTFASVRGYMLHTVCIVYLRCMCTSVSTYACVFLCMRARVHACMRVRVHAPSINACIHVCMHMYLCTYVSVELCYVCAYLYIAPLRTCTPLHTCIHTCTRVHTGTWIIDQDFLVYLFIFTRAYGFWIEIWVHAETWWYKCLDLSACLNRMIP